MRAPLPIALSVVVLVFANVTRPAAAGERLDVTLAHDGRQRHYFAYLPDGLDRTRPAALIVALHGGGSNGAIMERFSGLSEAADVAGFVVVYPDGSGRLSRALTWNGGTCCAYAKRANIDDVGFLIAVIDDVATRVRVDPDRVYATGISNGGMMAYRLAAERPDRIAAVAAIAASLEVDPTRLRGPVAVLHFHGTDDQYVPFTGGRGSRSRLAGSFRSVEETIGAWISVNRADPRAVVAALPDTTADGMRVRRELHGAQATGADVELYVIEGGGHSWPGRPKIERVLGAATLDIDANAILWAFFERHARSPGRR